MREMSVPVVDHFFDSSNASGSILHLAPFLFPTFARGSEGLALSPLTQGTTNGLFKVTYRRPDLASAPSDGPREVALVKVYGDGTEITIDREKEVRFHKALAEHNLAPPLLVRFLNGHAYSYLPGRVCATEEISDERVWRGVAMELARWHALLGTMIPDSEDKSHPNVWATAGRWLAALPETTDSQKAEKLILRKEFEHLKQQTGHYARQPLVLGHGDLLCGNIILQDPLGHATPCDVVKAKFIDYEHSTYCPPAFELANHFAEWAGFECDYSLLPTRAVRQAFIREYLLEHDDILRSQKGEEGSAGVPDAAVDELMLQVDQLRGFPGFYWGLCALIQAEAASGTIDFDYAGYAKQRFAEYWAWRGEEDGSRAQRNEPRPLREERWAAP